MSIRNATMSQIKTRVRLESGYSGRKGKLADEAADLAVRFLMFNGDDPVPMGAASGLTHRQWIENQTEAYVRQEMGAFWFSFILGPIISSVVQMIIEWWFDE